MIHYATAIIITLIVWMKVKYESKSGDYDSSDTFDIDIIMTTATVCGDRYKVRVYSDDDDRHKLIIMILIKVPIEDDDYVSNS